MFVIDAASLYTNDILIETKHIQGALQAYYYVQLASLLWRVSWGRARSVWVARGAAMWH